MRLSLTIACLMIVTVLVVAGVPAKAEDAALRTEAARFAKEAEFLQKQKRYEAAVEKAETAVAIEPNNDQYLNRLAESLINQAADVIHPSLVNTSFSSPEGYPKVERNGMQKGLQLAWRAFDVIHRNPGYAFHLTQLRKKFVDLAAIQHPDLQADVDKLNKAVLEHWRSEHYEATLKNVRDEKSFEKFAGVVLNGRHNVCCQSTLDAVVMYEKMIGDFAGFSRHWPQAKDADNAVRHFCRDFAECAAAYRASWNKNAAVDASLERSYKMLESGPNPVFTICGWLIRNKIDMQFARSNEDHVASQRWIDNVKTALASMPKDLPFADYSMMYDEAAWLLFFAKNWNESIRNGIAIMQTANHRQEFTGRLVLETMVKLAFPEYRDKFKDDLPQFVTVFEKQIELAAWVDVKQHQSLRARLASDHFLESSDGKTKARPWTKEVPIYTTQTPNNLRRILLHGETLFIFVVDNWPALRIDEFDLKSHTYKNGQPFPCPKRDATVRYPATSRYDSACVDNRNVYFGSYGNGIVVFPRDDSSPWTLTVEDGLPSDFVQAVGILNGKLYAGLGEEGKASWLIVVDLETRRWEILSSSNAREGKFPFCNLSPAPRFGLFIADSKRHRLLLAVEPGTHKNLGGIWTIDGKTGGIERTYPFAFGPIQHGHILADGDRLLLEADHANFLIDLAETNPSSNTVTLFTFPNKEYREKENWKLLDAKIPGYWLSRGTVWNGYLWGCLMCKDDKERQKFGDTSYWARVSIDGKSGIEMLRPIVIPSKDERVLWTPDVVCLPAPDGKGLIVSDRWHVSLLLFGH